VETDSWLISDDLSPSMVRRSLALGDAEKLDLRQHVEISHFQDRRDAKTTSGPHFF